MYVLLFILDIGIFDDSIFEIMFVKVNSVYVLDFLFSEMFFDKMILGVEYVIIIRY